MVRRYIDGQWVHLTEDEEIQAFTDRCEQLKEEEAALAILRHGPTIGVEELTDYYQDLI